MPTLINLFEVPGGVDTEFVAAWERARDFLAERDGFAATALHRSLSPDAEFRFVNVAEVNSVEAWQAAVQDPAFPRDLPGKPNPSLYETVREDHASNARPAAVLINPFEVPDGEGDAFLAAWEAARDAMRGADGYLGTRLYRSLAPNTRFGFVNVARWRSASDFQAALQRPDFQQAATAMRYRAHPALYEVVAS
jgi:heme-degrading monooxygenase HmoA